MAKKQTYEVVINRIAFASRTIEVEATSLKDAEKKALEVAGNYEFSEHGADYEVEFSTLKQ